MTATELIRSAVLVFLVVGGTYAALHNPPGLLSWPMYSSIAFYRFDLYTSPNMTLDSRIDQDLRTGVFDPFSTDGQIDRYLEFLRDVHGIHPIGTVVAVGRSGETTRSVGRGAPVDV
ncbi:hypothetical protein [Catenulispora rubra]|uniref:hypothetical protein n=1 Tax=Catenulispora rubra TaxID=280293 RepID=UPI0018924672|nr:hypothetical protein [Catenulispora rubra]